MILGILCFKINSLLSTTLTKPTGHAIINTGFNLPLLISSSILISAVGALPIAKITGSLSFAAFSTAA